MYFLDFLSEADQTKLKKFCKKEGIKKFLLKKNLLKFFLNQSPNTFLKNIAINNTLLIYSPQNIQISSQLLSSLSEFKNLTFFTMISQFKMFRPSEVQKMFKISAQKSAVKLLLAAKSAKIALKFALGFKKHLNF